MSPHLLAWTVFPKDFSKKETTSAKGVPVIIK
jgi:hypothetical protein